MSDKQVELIISNQEHQIALLMELLQSQPKLNIAEIAKLREYNRGV